MATISPGVSVTVTDESFYAPAGAGTVPLIVIATAQNKRSADGVTIAQNTTAAQAGKVKLITSQRELLTTYGNPDFKSLGGTPLHGHELNEYGLATAFSFLGIANRAYILRADVDLGALEASANPPTPVPAAGAYWLDTAATTWGIKKYTNGAWVKQTVKVPGANDITSSQPKASYGLNGDIAAVYFESNGDTAGTIQFWQKVSGGWLAIGGNSWLSATSATYTVGTHLNIPASANEGSIFFQTSQPNQGSQVFIRVWDSISAQFINESIVFFGTSGAAYNFYSSALVTGDLWGQTDSTGGIEIKRFNGNTATTVISSTITEPFETVNHDGNVSIRVSVNNGTLVDVTFPDGNISVDDMVEAFNDAFSTANATVSFTTGVVASNIGGKISIVNPNNRDITLSAGTVPGFVPESIGFIEQTYSNWETLSYEASPVALAGELADGTLWYDSVVSNFNLDLLVQTGGSWVAFSGDVQVAASRPTTQREGGSLVSGDIWVSTADLENYPRVYKWSGTAWVLVDNTDQVTSDGILFADFRQAGGSIDADAPNPALYPVGILGWNKRASGGNVKRWNAETLRWVDASGNRGNGSPYMLRKAQRQVVAAAMQAALQIDDLRSEINRFNLVAAPGYPECAEEMLALGTDRKDTVFSIIDSPLRLKADGTSIQAWANNTAGATGTGEDGLTVSGVNGAVYYPSGIASSITGQEIAVPSSYMALRTYAYNDQVAYPWFAPAGYQRGIVNNVGSVGYVDSVSGEFIVVSLNEGMRDTLWLNKINPIASFPSRGIVIMGDKTLSPLDSALDAVNVARLVIYMREQLDDIVRPFMFEPNDEITRGNAKTVVERFIGQIVSARGIQDFLVVCDGSNNTPARIDRNELWIDVAIQPMKSVRYIIIPIRIQNTLGANN
jgi:hypothetical protein